MGSGPGQPFERKILDESYEVEIVVKRTRISKTANDRGYFDAPAETAKGILAEIKFASADLDDIKKRTVQHISLVEDK